MDHSSIKKALLMQLMAELAREEMKPFKGDKKAEPMIAVEVEEDCEPGSKADRLKKLKKLASEE